MARWVISPVIGTGTADDPYRLKAADYGAHAAIIPGNEDGTPKFNWGICHFAGDETAADADTDLIVFPQLELDHVLTLAQRNWLITKLNNRGLPSGWVTAGITVRECLRTIGRWLDDKFDIDWVKVA